MNSSELDHTLQSHNKALFRTNLQHYLLSDEFWIKDISPGIYKLLFVANIPVKKNNSHNKIFTVLELKHYCTEIQNYSYLIYLRCEKYLLWALRARSPQNFLKLKCFTIETVQVKFYSTSHRCESVCECQVDLLDIPYFLFHKSISHLNENSVPIKKHSISCICIYILRH